MKLLAKPGSVLSDFPTFFSDFFNDSWFDSNREWMAKVPSSNIKEQDDAFIIEMAVPGLQKDDFHIHVDNGVLTVSSEAEHQNSENEDNYRRREYNYQSFSRSFTLPESVKAEDIQATYQDGLLMLNIPKKESLQKLPKKEIQVQ